MWPCQTSKQIYNDCRDDTAQALDGAKRTFIANEAHDQDGGSSDEKSLHHSFETGQCEHFVPETAEMNVHEARVGRHHKMTVAQDPYGKAGYDEDAQHDNLVAHVGVEGYSKYSSPIKPPDKCSDHKRNRDVGYGEEKRLQTKIIVTVAVVGIVKGE